MAEVTAQLSDREQEVLRLVATGATNQQIANTLNISINTVKVHLRNIFEKIEVTSRTEATMYAVRNGLVEMDRGRLAALPDICESAVPAEPSADAEESADTASPFVEQVLVLPNVNLMWRSWLRTPRFLTSLGLIICLGAVALGLWKWYVPTFGTSVAMPEVEKWKRRAPLTSPRKDFAVVDYDNRLYVIGGTTSSGVSDSVERYDPVTNTWVPLSMSNKPTPVTGVQAVVLGGRIYVPGGEQANGAVSAAFEVYDPRNEHWQKLEDLPAPRSHYALAKVEGKLYLFGGWDGRQDAADVWSYDPASGLWEKHTSLPTPRRNAGAAVIDGLVYIVGGESAQGPLRTHERYDPTNDGNSQPWTSAAPLPAAISTPALVALVNELIVFDPSRHLALQFTPTTEKWSAIAIPQDTPLSSRSILLGTNLYIFGLPTDPHPGIVSEYHILSSTFLPLTAN
ncbi:MAG: LuxR family transcriptional regulator [Herpetosiphonaceae bacterium]|nr:LuxR family transcriptional regulator [Herpetosiphonaceae bacterium]